MYVPDFVQDANRFDGYSAFCWAGIGDHPGSDPGIAEYTMDEIVQAMTKAKITGSRAVWRFLARQPKWHLTCAHMSF